MTHLITTSIVTVDHYNEQKSSGEWKIAKIWGLTFLHLETDYLSTNEKPIMLLFQ